MKKFLILVVFQLLNLLSYSQNGIQYTKPAWNLSGNNIATGIPYLGTQNAVSLFLKSNTNSISSYLKLDTIGRLYWAQNSTNRISFEGLVTFPSVPAIYLGVTTPTSTNFLAIGDGTNNVLNAPTALFLRSQNKNFLEANLTSTTSLEYIVFDPISSPTVAANANMPHIRIAGNSIGWNAGTTALQQKINISADTYSSNGAAIITHAVGVSITAPTAGTGMTFSNPAWGLRSTGNINFTGATIIGGALTTVPTKTLDVRGNAIISSSLTVNGVVNTSTLQLGASAVLTGGNTGTVAVRSDNIIQYQFGWAVQSPADGATYWLSSTGVFNVNVAGQNKIVLPVNCTLIGYSFNNVNLGSNGSGETATLNVRKNGTTTTALNSSLSFASTQLVSDFTKNLTYSAGDDFAPNIFCPTWVTNPVQTVLTVVFYFRQD